MLWCQWKYFCVRDPFLPIHPQTKPDPHRKKERNQQTSYRAWEVCPDTVPSLAGADLWHDFFPSDYPNLYHSLPHWAWSSCDKDFDTGKCKSLGFEDASDKFYKPGDYPGNGTSTLHNIHGTVAAPPSGTIITWSQASATYTVTATGYDQKAVASQSEYRATASDPNAFPEETGAEAADNGAAGVKPAGVAALLGAVAVLMAL